MASMVIKDGTRQYKPIENIVKDDVLLVRNQELVPADAVLLKGNANIDYSFVTGEEAPVAIQKGEMIFGGGKQIGTAIEVQVSKTVSASRLTRLWNNDTFQKEQDSAH